MQIYAHHLHDKLETKWSSITWIIKIMKNYNEYFAPNVTCFPDKQRTNYQRETSGDCGNLH